MKFNTILLFTIIFSLSGISIPGYEIKKFERKATFSPHKIIEDTNRNILALSSSIYVLNRKSKKWNRIFGPYLEKIYGYSMQSKCDIGVDGKIIYVYEDSIYVSKDLGQNWKSHQLLSKIGEVLNSDYITYLSDSTCFIESNGRMYHSDSTLLNWKVQDKKLNKYSEIEFFNGNYYALISGSDPDGGFYKRIDNTWQKIHYDTGNSDSYRRYSEFRKSNDAMYFFNSYDEDGPSVIKFDGKSCTKHKVPLERINNIYFSNGALYILTNEQIYSLDEAAGYIIKSEKSMPEIEFNAPRFFISKDNEFFVTESGELESNSNTYYSNGSNQWKNINLGGEPYFINNLFLFNNNNLFVNYVSEVMADLEALSYIHKKNNLKEYSEPGFVTEILELDNKVIKYSYINKEKSFSSDGGETWENYKIIDSTKTGYENYLCFWDEKKGDTKVMFDNPYTPFNIKADISVYKNTSLSIKAIKFRQEPRVYNINGVVYYQNNETTIMKYNLESSSNDTIYVADNKINSFYTDGTNIYYTSNKKIIKYNIASKLKTEIDSGNDYNTIILDDKGYIFADTWDEKLFVYKEDSLIQEFDDLSVFKKDNRGKIYLLSHDYIYVLKDMMH